MPKRLFISTFFLSQAIVLAGNSGKIFYHNLRLTDSEPVVSEWKVASSRRIENYIVEEIDSENRVFRLTTFIQGKLAEQSCYVVPIITYQYKKDTIIQKSFRKNDSAITELECGRYQRTDYILSGDSLRYCLNFNEDLGFLKKPIEKDPKEYREYYESISKYWKGKKEVCYGVLGYEYSIAKRKGRDLLTFQNE